MKKESQSDHRNSLASLASIVDMPHDLSMVDDTKIQDFLKSMKATNAKNEEMLEAL